MKMSGHSEAENPLRVRRGRVDCVDLYEIKDNELEQLEQGANGGLDLNFAIFFVSLAFGAVSSLSTATFENEIARQVFVMVSVVGALLGIVFSVRWARSRSTVKQLCERIRQRIPPDGPPVPPLPAPKVVASVTAPSSGDAALTVAFTTTPSDIPKVSVSTISPSRGEAKLPTSSDG